MIRRISDIIHAEGEQRGVRGETEQRDLVISSA